MKFLATFTNDPWNAIFYRGSGTVSTVDTDPNTGGSVGQTNSNGGVEGAQFTTPQWFKEASSGALVLCAQRTVGGASSITCSVWVFEAQSSSWILMKSGISVAEGTPVVVPILRGHGYKVAIQITAVASSPAGLIGLWMPQP